MDETSIFNSFNEPSIAHWLAMMLGQWIYAFTGIEVTIEHPVSAAMVLLACLTVIALMAYAIIFMFFGGKAIFSAGATANLVSKPTQFMHVRVLSVFMLLMPTTYALDALNKYSVSISNGQVITVGSLLWGSGVADVGWHIAGESLIRYNISGLPQHFDTVSKSNSLAKSFLCNEFYYENIGKNANQSLIYYSVNDGELTGSDKLSNIAFPTKEAITQAASSYPLKIYLGGKDGNCGSFSFSYGYDDSTTNDSIISRMETNLYGGLRSGDIIARNEAITAFISYLDIYSTFADSYYTIMGRVNPDTIAETKIAQGNHSKAIDVSLLVNEGGLPTATAGDSLERKIASITDALNYLAIRLSYEQSAMSQTANDAIIKALTGVSNNEEADLEDFSSNLFNEWLGGYLNAGMFWSVFQNISDLLYKTNREINSFDLANADIDEATLCQDVGFVTRAAKSISSFFGDNRYLCQSSQHVLESFSIIEQLGYIKARNTIPTTISAAGSSYTIDAKKWAANFSKSDPSTRPKSADYDSEVNGLFWLVNKIWGQALKFNSDNAVANTGNITSTQSLLEGDSSFMMDMSGTTSPFSLLTQFGQETRDAAILVEGAAITMSSFYKAFDRTVDDKAKDRNPILAFMIRFFGFMFGSTIERIATTLHHLYTTLLVSSLGLTYGIPVIPIVGWVFIGISILFTALVAIGAINFGAILMGLPKGDGVFAPDTERIVSLVFGTFIRQFLIVVGFVAHLTIAYAGLSFLNLIWLGSWVNKLSNLGILDGIFTVIVFFAGYMVAAFYICLYSFRFIGKYVDEIGVWVSTVLVGGALGSHGDEVQTAGQGLLAMSGKLDELIKNTQKPQAPTSGAGGGNSNTKDKDPSTKTANSNA
ncbi:hypothetical protein [Vibrio sp. Hal054]|uniref:hypothetical protein n=1 Tax=Vibrio sp. Hal054 TaxID=3035158 RepID=UPI00301D90EE